MDTPIENDTHEAIALARESVRDLKACAADEFAQGNDQRAKALRKAAEKIEKALASLEPVAE